MTLDITANDLFCGAGGSSTGLVAAGVRVKTAINHWQRAIETHSTNHPTTDHDCMDVRLVKPSEYPRTTIGWFSPECTSHSLAKGKRRIAVHQMDLWGEKPHFDPAEERSRATMREVIEWTECHQYEIVIVENVVDIRYWEFYDEWLQTMLNLGYEHRALYLNAQFFGVPQSRDRLYIVFWKRGNRTPDLDFRPSAICQKHGQIEAVQSFKKSDYRWGRYGKKRQYVYTCPRCGAVVEPQTVPAWTVIDWSISSPIIGAREKPLKPKTIARIRAGLEKYAGTWMLVDTAYAGQPGYTYPIDEPMGTQTARQTYALVSPFMLSYMNNETPARGVSDPMYTVAGSHTAPLIVPPAFLMQYYGRNDAQSRLDDALPTVTGDPRHALVSLPFITEYYGQTESGHSVENPLSTITSLHKHGLVTPPFLAVLKDTATTVGIDDSLTTIVAMGSQHALITPPFFASVNHSDIRNSPIDEPFPTIMTRTTPTLVTPPLTSEDIDTMLPRCGFRMLEPDELKRGMSFPNSYVILGNKREQVKQAGNAVCPNVAEWIARRCVESLS